MDCGGLFYNYSEVIKMGRSGRPTKEGKEGKERNWKEDGGDKEEENGGNG